MNIESNICAVLAHSAVYFSREEAGPAADARCDSSGGYSIPVSISQASTLVSDIENNLETNIAFGNSDNPNNEANQTPETTTTATSAAAEPGGTAIASGSSPVGPGNVSPFTQPTAAATASTSTSMTTWLIVAVVAFVLWKHFHKP